MAPFLDTFVSDESISDLDLLWRRNDKTAWASIVEMAAQSEAEASRVEAFMAEKFYAAWLSQLETPERFSNTGLFNTALSRVRSGMYQLSGDEWGQGKALFRQSVLMAAKMANDDDDGHAIPAFWYNDLISDEPLYSDDEAYEEYEDGNQ